MPYKRLESVLFWTKSDKKTDKPLLGIGAASADASTMMKASDKTKRVRTTVVVADFVIVKITCAWGFFSSLNSRK